MSNRHVVDLIGPGRMGETWKARDTGLDRIAAIKKVKEQDSECSKQKARPLAVLNLSCI